MPSLLCGSNRNEQFLCALQVWKTLCNAIPGIDHVLKTWISKKHCWLDECRAKWAAKALTAPVIFNCFWSQILGNWLEIHSPDIESILRSCKLFHKKTVRVQFSLNLLSWLPKIRGFSYRRLVSPDYSQLGPLRCSSYVGYHKLIRSMRRSSCSKV